MVISLSTSTPISFRLQLDIKFIPELNLLVCKACSHCVWVNELSTHLSTPSNIGHSRYTPREAAEAQSLAKGLWPTALSSTSDDCSSIDAVIDSCPPAFEHLDIFQDGLKCPYCNQVNLKWDSLRKHITLQHPENNPGNKFKQADCERVPCQRLFSSRKGSRYFQVTTSNASAPVTTDDQTPSFITAMQEASAARSKLIEESERVIDGSTTDQVSAFLKRARFHILFARCDRTALYNASKLPAQRGDEERSTNARPHRYVHLVRAVLKALESCAGSVRLAGSALRRELKRSSPTPTTVPFTVPNDATISTYARTCARIIIFLLTETAGIPVHFSGEQKAALIDVRRELAKRVSDKSQPTDIHTNTLFFEVEDETEVALDEDDEDEEDSERQQAFASVSRPVFLFPRHRSILLGVSRLRTY